MCHQLQMQPRALSSLRTRGTTKIMNYYKCNYEVVTARVHCKVNDYIIIICLLCKLNDLLLLCIYVLIYRQMNNVSHLLEGNLRKSVVGTFIGVILFHLTSEFWRI